MTNAPLDNEIDLRGLKPLAKFLPFSPPKVDADELEQLREALFSGWLTTGPRADEFEKVISLHLGVTGSLALNSCTAALHLGLKVLDLAPGQAVITSPLTFVSTAHAAVYNGGHPFLADVSADTGNLDPARVEDFLEIHCQKGPNQYPVHKKTGLTIVALVPVHYGGHAVDLPRLWQVAVKYNLHMLEDAAHALGTSQNGLPIGNPGHRPKGAEHLISMAAFSFYATKNITTGEGGLLTCSDPALLDRARRLAAYGISDARRIWGRYAPKGTWIYDVAELGYKYNFTDIQAALGLAQMRKLPDLQEARKRNANIWTKHLEKFSHLLELPVTRQGCGHSWHLYPIRLKIEALNCDRDALIIALKALNIGTSVMFIPIHYHSFYRQTLGYVEGDFPIAEDFFKREISLPVSPSLAAEDIEAAASLTCSLLARLAR
ncbi:MAG: DegT/DnrJ/EryC1/StrS family aminotransferase [Deltaproteobacteria bacterium]|jgi:dTDP-4-amino-4,6-dideoxygalactose transaminase|nr:DegT/DnrJ/EryC1/StrS family aminotransferase [Deltaproteobacteria bacterium]